MKDEKSGRSFGYIKIPSFYRDFENTKNGRGRAELTEDVLKELKKIDPGNVSGLVID